jgi:hypothetical protein
MLPTRLSGAVSMYYLKPIVDNINLPLVALLGDIHGSYNGMCSKCECETNDCCHRIYDKSFLQKLNKLSTTENPIDFYVEYFNDNNEGEFNSPLDKFRTPSFQSCYKHTIKKHSNCPAQNIRWQYSDIRFSKFKNNIEYIFDSIYVFIEFCESLTRDDEYKGLSIDIWREISNCIHNKRSKFGKTVIDAFTQEFPDKGGSYIGYHIIEFYTKSTGINLANIEQTRHVIDVLRNSSEETLAHNLVELLFSYSNTTGHQSLIYKQFVKQDNSLVFANKEFITDCIKTSLTEKLADFQFDKVDKKAFNFLAKFDIRDTYNDISTLLLHINSTFVDIYTILRATKKNPNPPSLCFGYFGNAHVINIANILVQSGYYTKAFFIDEDKDNDNRCLEFDMNNLLTDLRRYNKMKSNTKTKSKTKSKSKSKSKSKTKTKSKSSKSHSIRGSNPGPSD